MRFTPVVLPPFAAGVQVYLPFSFLTFPAVVLKLYLCMNLRNTTRKSLVYGYRAYEYAISCWQECDGIEGYFDHVSR